MASTADQFELVPSPGRVVVKLKKRDEVTAAGIIITPMAQERNNAGEIVAIYEPPAGERELAEDFNDEEFEDPFVWHVGDYVIFGKYTGVELDWGREKVLILNEKDILAKLVPKVALVEEVPVVSIDRT